MCDWYLNSAREQFFAKHMTLFAVTIKVIAGIIYFFIYQPICLEKTMMEEE